jgi:hypothetical protein
MDGMTLRDRVLPKLKFTAIAGKGSMFWFTLPLKSRLTEGRLLYEAGTVTSSLRRRCFKTIRF